MIPGGRAASEQPRSDTLERQGQFLGIGIICVLSALQRRLRALKIRAIL